MTEPFTRAELDMLREAMDALYCTRILDDREYPAWKALNEKLWKMTNEAPN